jgi:cell wall-associated protease
MKQLFTLLISFAFFITTLSAQSYFKGWHLGNIDSNHVYGANVEKAYAEILKNKTPKKKVIVAVIDSGIDTTHEDLKSVIWTNKKEIPGNGLDDDKNGYIDDLHGRSKNIL